MKKQDFEAVRRIVDNQCQGTHFPPHIDREDIRQETLLKFLEKGYKTAEYKLVKVVSGQRKMDVFKRQKHSPLIQQDTFLSQRGYAAPETQSSKQMLHDFKDLSHTYINSGTEKQRYKRELGVRVCELLYEGYKWKEVELSLGKNERTLRRYRNNFADFLRQSGVTPKSS